MEIRQLHEQGMKISQIARLLNLDRRTVRKAVKKKETPRYVRVNKGKGKLDTYKEYIANRLENKELTAQKMYEEVVRQGYAGKYSLVAEYVAGVKKENRNKAILRFETIPGEQAQVDWGYLGKLYDQEQKKWVYLHCFLMILGYSRMLYIEIFERANLENFLVAHNNAFLYFGGYTREILYDNLKLVVIKRTLRAKDSEFNKKFMDFAGYYGFNPILCRPYKPNTKGKVENSVNFVKQNFFNGEEFYSLRDVNEKAYT